MSFWFFQVRLRGDGPHITQKGAERDLVRLSLPVPARPALPLGIR